MLKPKLSTDWWVVIIAFGIVAVICICKLTIGW
jgi:hypothetical protein